MGLQRDPSADARAFGQEKGVEEDGWTDDETHRNTHAEGVLPPGKEAEQKLHTCRFVEGQAGSRAHPARKERLAVRACCIPDLEPTWLPSGLTNGRVFYYVISVGGRLGCPLGEFRWHNCSRG